jgi:signal transduction histidine kinase
MGGRLHLVSAPGEGATFVVELPRPADDLAAHVAAIMQR